MTERNEESTLEEEPTLGHDEQVDEENQKADDFNKFARNMELAIEAALYGLYEQQPLAAPVRAAFLNIEDQIVKIAVFKNIKYGYTSPCEEGSLDDSEEYIRTSEYVDVIFPPLDSIDILNREVALLEQSKKDVQAAAQLQLTAIDSRIGKLLALPQCI